MAISIILPILKIRIPMIFDVIAQCSYPPIAFLGEFRKRIKTNRDYRGHLEFSSWRVWSSTGIVNNLIWSGDSRLHWQFNTWSVSLEHDIVRDCVLKRFLFEKNSEFESNWRKRIIAPFLISLWWCLGAKRAILQQTSETRDSYYSCRFVCHPLVALY
jgi:hypothetical protein